MDSTPDNPGIVQIFVWRAEAANLVEHPELNIAEASDGNAVLILTTEMAARARSGERSYEVKRAISDAASLALGVAIQDFDASQAG